MTKKARSSKPATIRRTDHRRHADPKHATEDHFAARADAQLGEERRGPLVLSTDAQEVTLGFDDSKPRDVKREPFPQSRGYH